MSATTSTPSVQLPGQDALTEKTPRTVQDPKPGMPVTRGMFTSQFTDASLSKERTLFMEILAGGCFAMIIVMFCVFSIYWGALWHTPDHQLDGWVVNFDGGGEIGTSVMQGLLATNPSSSVKWREVDWVQAGEVGHWILEQRAWVAVVINANASENLANAGSDYDPTSAITYYAVEARNENGFRSLIRPTVEGALISLSQQFSTQRVANMSSEALGALAAASPQALTTAFLFTQENLAPFDISVASAITFVGLIYLLILTFFIVMIGLTAREVSGLEVRLTTASLIRLRLGSVGVAYFVISLFYSLLSLAFQVDFTRKFGHSGFLVFWMVNFVGMLSVGLALESMITLLTIRFVPFFMILWIISNVSVCALPIEVLPNIYNYGYAMPFYNVSCMVRTILFGTKNQVGLHFGVLIAWAAVSVITLPTFQWYRRRVLLKANED